jgi:hypothetical protein
LIDSMKALKGHSPWVAMRGVHRLHRYGYGDVMDAQALDR